MRHLGELGWTVTVRGRGTFVAERENRPVKQGAPQIGETRPGTAQA
ncbi:hypothetical protein DKM19_17675 [Streptosporangium sp. 'caverna']|nr:hypothetical protein [Streptosporangium sp. 'caverna']AWS42925.1 hypothetical protein DKM19_17675 [Streptosporangium sp. 'caverna']